MPINYQPASPEQQFVIELWDLPRILYSTSSCRGYFQRQPISLITFLPPPVSLRLSRSSSPFVVVPLMMMMNSIRTITHLLLSWGTMHNRLRLRGGASPIANEIDSFNHKLWTWQCQRGGLLRRGGGGHPGEQEPRSPLKVFQFKQQSSHHPPGPIFIPKLLVGKGLLGYSDS